MNYSMSRKGMLPIKMSIYSKLELSLPRYTRVCISIYLSESRGIPNFFGKGEQNATTASLGASMSKKLTVTRLSVLFFPACNSQPSASIDCYPNRRSDFQKENLSPVIPHPSPHSPPPSVHLHAFTKFSERWGLVLIPPVAKPALDFSDIPVQLF